MTDLDRALKDALVLGLENDATAERVLQIAAPFVERAFQKQVDRIEKLEAALKKIALDDPDCCMIADRMRETAEIALEGKDD